MPRSGWTHLLGKKRCYFGITCAAPAPQTIVIARLFLRESGQWWRFACDLATAHLPPLTSVEN
jgi:hypothetical protein